MTKQGQSDVEDATAAHRYFIVEHRALLLASLDGLELAQHCGHADIIREQVLARRSHVDG